MDACHPEAKKVAEKIFKSWEDRYSKFVKALESGKFVYRFIRSRVPALLDQVSYNQGLYDMHDVPLHRCIKAHIDRWKSIQTIAKNMTQAFLEQLSKRCLSMTQIVVVSILMKIRYFLGDITDTTHEKALMLPVPHYNPNISWPSVFDTMLCGLENPSAITCPEMKTIFQHTVRAVLDAIEKNPHIFEKNIDLLGQLYENKWEDITFTDEQTENLCFGGVPPHLFTRENGRILRVLQCYRNFENGDFMDLCSLMLSVQLTLRTSLLLQTRQDRAYLSNKDLKDKFESAKLVRIMRIMNNEPLFELFQYPRSFSGGKRPFVYCEVKIHGVSYFPTLEMAVVYAMFCVDSSELIFESLRRFFVEEKIQTFKKSSSDVVMYKEMPLPKKWLKYKLFKELLATN